MSAIWHHDNEGWRLLAPAGFPSETALHDLIEQAPQMMPLAGSPSLTVVGREVALGNNYADLIAVEPNGRLVIIEIKLAKNAEARRAVIAQVLTYAASLRGLKPVALEQGVLGSHLAKRGFASLAHAAAAADQTASFDETDFGVGLSNGLAEGRFRLVLVLDQAPSELVRLAEYLEAVADKLVIDLITVSAYDVGDTKVVVPQRIAHGPSLPHQHALVPMPAAAAGHSSDGGDEFAAAIAVAPTALQPELARLTEWARSLEHEGLASLATNKSEAGNLTLLPRLRDEGVGLVTIWFWQGGSLSFWRSVIERRAPNCLGRIEQAAAPAKVGQGTTTNTPTPALLDALTDAYREAVLGKVHLSVDGSPSPG
ncbi:MAG TPA: hypothetical protein VER37_06455 [Thermomicrobiales bacterium]|nr:hypothetical protein [Thermomicrobiales bacterium]